MSKELDRVLTDIKIVTGKQTPVINISPSEISILDWRMVCELGPFGNSNPAPKLFTVFDPAIAEISPLGKDNKHSYIKINNEKLLAFNIIPKEILEMSEKIKGFIYHPRLDYWHHEEQLQFILDCAVIDS